MKKLILIIVLIVNINAWEVNTHRAIERFAITKASNLNTFLENSGIKNTNYRSEIFEGYTNIITRRPVTYFDYLNKKYSNDEVSEWGQTFDSFIRDYQDLIESGSILEDAVYDTAPLSFNGRFNNHFYEAQNGGHALTFGYGIRVNALVWGTNGAHVGAYLRENKYSYLNTLDYFKKAFTETNPTVRKKYQAKMLVGVGHLLHLMNDMTSPAHTRDDSHPLGDAMEICGRGGDSGNEHRGFRIEGNTIKDYLGIRRPNGSINLPNIPKYSKFSDFISQESYWVSTHFFSNDTVFTKALPAVSDTYQEFVSDDGVVEKYYIRSDGTTGIPGRTKLGIRIKSYIISELRGKYYTGDASEIVLNKSTFFKGDQTVLEENARILIPRAIANARNFLDYFFRGRLSAEITNTTITLTNDSITNTVKNANTVTFNYASKNDTLENPSAYHVMYEDGTLHHFDTAYPEYYGNTLNYDDSKPVIFWEKDFSNHIHWATIEPQESIDIPIQPNAKAREIMRTKKIIVFYQGYIGDTIGSSVCYASTSIGGVAQMQ